MSALAPRLLPWFARHGRTTLPWQTGDPYHVWVSEIMLQQTQVATVIPYFERFIAAWPQPAALAAAELDAVLHLWTGLGYYARGRNLHRAARQMVAEHGGRVPADAAALEALPGIGRSTAGAILALGFGQRAAILDGNVKRVLARHFAVEGWPGRSAVVRRLWALAEEHTPTQHTGAYTQAIMDLGALVCLPRRPLCAACPLAGSCAARAEGRTAQLPTPRPRRTLPLRHTRMLVLTRAADGAVLLERRPPTGIWGGLWCFPELDPHGDAPADPAAPSPRLPAATGPVLPGPAIEHTFTHYRLRIQPLTAELAIDDEPAGRMASLMDGGARLWYKLGPCDDPPGRLGLAAPVRRLAPWLADPAGRSPSDHQECEP